MTLGPQSMGIGPLQLDDSQRTVRYVRRAIDLSGDLSSDVVYILDGIIDMGDQSITVPAGGLNLRGASFDISGLTSSANNYKMFISPVDGSGNLIGLDYFIQVDGVNSQVYDLVSDTGNEAFEFQRINYINCTSLGEINNYRQGLEEGTGRFGGEPELTLSGVWGGFRITTSIVRMLPDTFTGSLFKAGTGFSMTGRFLTDINADLAANASLIDFAPANFPNASTVQIGGAIISRNGVTDASDATTTPNITEADLPSIWSNNVGLPNTHVGGRSTITTEVTTVISTASTFVDLAGTTSTDLLEHFDQPANGQLRNLGDSPISYNVTVDLILESMANDQLAIKIVKWDNSASGFVDVTEKIRQVNSLSGPRDVAIVNFVTPVQLDVNDYVKIQVANNSGTANITAELDSSFTVSER